MPMVLSTVLRERLTPLKSRVVLENIGSRCLPGGVRTDRGRNGVPAGHVPAPLDDLHQTNTAAAAGIAKMSAKIGASSATE